MEDSLFKTPAPERSYLESLTTRELIRLADSLGIDVPPDLERVFIIAEILDIDFDNEVEDDEFEESVLVETSISDPVHLPKQYNITFIEVMIRDPLWAFIFWEIKSHDKEFYEKAHDFEGYHLKVSALSDLPKNRASKEDDSFIIPVGITDTSWYVNFPPQEGRFKIEFCAALGKSETALAVSRPFNLPALYNPPNKRDIEHDALYKNPLARLSGIEDFKIIRSKDRSFREK